MTCHVMRFLASSGHNWGGRNCNDLYHPLYIYSWDRENYIFPKVTKVGSIFGHRIDYQYNGYRFWEASGTYPAKINPPPPARFNSSNKFASCQLDLFVITLCLMSIIISEKYLWKGCSIFILIPPPSPKDECPRQMNAFENCIVEFVRYK